MRRISIASMAVCEPKEGKGFAPDFERLLAFDFRNAIGAHGPPMKDTTKDDLRASVQRIYGEGRLGGLCSICRVNDEALERRTKRLATWSSKAFGGGDTHRELEDEALEEWAAMDPLGRLALTWELSLEQFGGRDESVEPRLPRSAYKLERR